MLFLFYKISIVLFFILVGALSLVHTLITKNYVGFELCTLVTIITSMKYGFTTGLVVGVSSITLGLILGMNLDYGTIVSILGFALIAFLSSFFGFKDILLVGLALTLLYDIILVTFYYFTGSNPFTLFSYFTTHLILNYFIFSSVAPFFITLIS